MKHEHQIRNFFRHAQRFGLFSSIVSLIFDVFTVDEICFNDDGSVTTSSTLYL